MNPELQRYLWLELTPHRLLAMPLLLLAVLGLIDLLSEGDALRPAAVAGYWLVVAIGVLWGGRAASEAVVSEVIEGTWDQQRLSSLGPWSMTWAKLVGAPAFTWYGCLPCLVLIALAPRAGAGIAAALADALLLAMIVLLSHAMGLLASLVLTARGPVVTGRSAMWLHLVGLGCAAPVLLIAAAGFSEGWHGTVVWLDLRIPTRTFVLASVAVFTSWAVFGCYRMMRSELQLRATPWPWLGFVVFAMVYAAGWGGTDAVQSRLSIGGTELDATGAALLRAQALALGLGYVLLLLEVKDPVSWHRLLGALADGRQRAALEVVPRWSCVVPAAGMVAAVAFALDADGRVLCLSALVFFVRDAGLVVLLNLGPRRTRADAAALFYLAVLYLLAPALVLASGAGSPSGWLLPAAQGSVAAAVLPGLAQAVLAWAAARSRWRRYRAAWG